jgi:hypothetical protein
MAFADHEKTIFAPRMTALDKLEKFLAELPEDERKSCLNILTNAPEKRVMVAFRDEGQKISYDTLKQWKEKNNVV